MLGRSTIVGLSGGIGTGKSRVSALLRELGAAVECADEIVHALQAPGAPGLAAIEKHFGPQFLLPSGELDRAKLGEHVFRDAEARRALGQLIHPLVQRELARRVASHAQGGRAVIVADIPLLLEGGDPRERPGALPFDVIALVYAPEAVQLERIMERDGLSRESAQRRIRAQRPIEEKRALADEIIENAGAWEDTARQVRALYERWAAPAPAR